VEDLELEEESGLKKTKFDNRIKCFNEILLDGTAKVVE